jgi:hypothetical protein
MYNSFLVSYDIITVLAMLAKGFSHDRIVTQKLRAIRGSITIHEYLLLYTSIIYAAIIIKSEVSVDFQQTFTIF